MKHADADKLPPGAFCWLNIIPGIRQARLLGCRFLSLAIYLPEMVYSLLDVLLRERFVFSRIAPVRHWLAYPQYEGTSSKRTL